MEMAPFSYLDDELIDELWRLEKREGISQERVASIKESIEASARFKLPNILNWLESDLNGGVDADRSADASTRTRYAAPLRLMFLLELLAAKQMSVSGHKAAGELQPGDLIDVVCPTFNLAPLPRLADYWNVALKAEVAEDDASAKEKAGGTLEAIEKVPRRFRAISIWRHLSEQSQASEGAGKTRDRNALARLQDDYGETLIAMMDMSDNDLWIGAALSLRDILPNRSLKDWERDIWRMDGGGSSVPSVLSGPFGSLSADTKRYLEGRNNRDAEIKRKARAEAKRHADTLIVTCFEESKLKKNVAALSVNGAMRLVGRVVNNVLDARTRMIAVQPMALSAAAEAAS